MLRLTSLCLPRLRNILLKKFLCGSCHLHSNVHTLRYASPKTLPYFQIEKPIGYLNNSAAPCTPKLTGSQSVA